VSLAGAVSSEPQMVQATMEFMDKETYTEKLVGDKVYDCAALCMCFTLLVRYMIALKQSPACWL
jgi:hypothetical protein